MPEETSAVTDDYNEFLYHYYSPTTPGYIEEELPPCQYENNFGFQRNPSAGEEQQQESQGATVGGEVYPINKFSLLMPWSVLAIVIVTGGMILLRQRSTKNRKIF